MDSRPIGVFDSGLGGLTAVKEINAVLPRESIVYFGDTGRVPYGTRGREIIRKYAREDMDFLLGKGVKAVLSACGTVSSTASDIGRGLPVPYFEVVAPAARAALNATKNGRIAVIGTQAAIRSGAYERELLGLREDLEIFPEACPLFVPLVENGMISQKDPAVRIICERYLTPLKESGADTLILGCTHFPLLRDAIRGVMGDDVTLIDSGREAAIALCEGLESLGLLNDGERREEYWVSDDPEGFKSVAELFLGRELELRQTSLEQL